MSWRGPIVARCDPCHGTGRRITRGIQVTCGDCGGCGRVHCCEGEQAQPEYLPPPKTQDERPK